MLWFSITLLHLYCNYRLVVNISCQSNTRSLLDYCSYNYCKYDSNSKLLLFTRRKMMVKDRFSVWRQNLPNGPVPIDW